MRTSEYQKEKSQSEEEVPSTPPNKIRAISTEVESTYDDLTFSDEESSSILLMNVFPETSSQKQSVPDQEQEAETIPPIIINEDGDIAANKKMMHDAYLKIRQDLCDLSSQKDITMFRKYQINNIDKLGVGETFHFSSESSDIEAILSLHHIMFIDLTKMKKPLYLDIDERKWRASIRQPKLPTPPSFFGEIMDEYEREINDIDELRSKFYDMWGKYRDKVIYSDNERRLFEATQAVARALANTESLSSREHRATYGRSQGRKPDITIYRIMEKDESRGKREETCFVEAKHFSVTKNSKIGGYNLYKVAILCQGGINNIISSRGNTPGIKSFGGHVCEGYIYLGMMNLEYDWIYRFFQLSEIKLAQKLSEFNLVRKLIIETFNFKCHIDNLYSNENNKGSSSRDAKCYVT
ncbi:hypothetical protein C1645_735133 [Glomus cerebriforme]|uniref:Uncharacterized protein n=1 Tax=Glomus cerebriforme TaxID=658196 RepID=A0A397TCC2_9GLOM|nr:hypothetical protein C1645_735133 [Glomus cerebriforme]